MVKEQAVGQLWFSLLLTSDCFHGVLWKLAPPWNGLPKNGSLTAENLVFVQPVASTTSNCGGLNVSKMEGAPLHFNERPNVGVYKRGLLSLLPLHISICSCSGCDRLQPDYYNKSPPKQHAEQSTSLWPPILFPKSDHHAEQNDQMHHERQAGTVNLFTI